MHPSDHLAMGCVLEFVTAPAATPHTSAKAPLLKSRPSKPPPAKTSHNSPSSSSGSESESESTAKQRQRRSDAADRLKPSDGVKVPKQANRKQLKIVVGGRNVSAVSLVGTAAALDVSSVGLKVVADLSLKGTREASDNKDAASWLASYAGSHASNRVERRPGNQAAASKLSAKQAVKEAGRLRVKVANRSRSLAAASNSTGRAAKNELVLRKALSGAGNESSEVPDVAPASQGTK